MLLIDFFLIMIYNKNVYEFFVFVLDLFLKIIMFVEIMFVKGKFIFEKNCRLYWWIIIIL